MTDRNEELAERFQSSLRKIMRCSKAVFIHEMAEYGVTMPQFHLMKFVAYKEQATVSEVSGMMMSSSPTASRMIDGLCAKELLEKSKGEEDQRVTFLKLTKKGKALLRKIDVAQREIIYEVFKSEDLKKLELAVSQFEVISEKWLALAKKQMEKEPDE